MATFEDTVTEPRSLPADVSPAFALKRKLRAVSWPFRALGTEGARELFPGPLPTLLTRCKQRPVLGERNSWRKENFSAGGDMRRGRGCRGAVSQITLAEKEIGLKNEENHHQPLHETLRNIFCAANFSPGSEFPLQPPPLHHPDHTHTGRWGLGKGIGHISILQQPPLYYL